jgi:hypothetical protein
VSESCDDLLDGIFPDTPSIALGLHAPTYTGFLGNDVYAKIRSLGQTDVPIAKAAKQACDILLKLKTIHCINLRQGG